MSDKPAIGDAEVHALAARLLGARAEVAPVGTPGMETHAYRVETADRVACLRIGRSTRGFAKDRWAFERLGDQLPVPRVWELGELPGGRGAYCLSAWASGATLQDLSAEQVDRVLPAVLDAWELLQTANVSDLDADEPALDVPAGAWAEAHAREIAAVRDEHARLAAFLPSERGLVHGDWGANNLLVDDGRITGILDWENATIGDPLRDVAGRFWATWPPVVTCMTRQAAYAERRLGHLPHYRERALHHDLGVGLSELAAGVEDGDEEFAAWVLARCLELLEA